MTENIPQTMHAVVLTGHGGLDKLEFHRDWPVPVPESDEVLIRVAACGLNNRRPARCIARQPHLLVAR